MRGVRGTTPDLRAGARRLRQVSTPAEDALWQALRGRAVDGLKWRRQHPVGPFVLDFYCPALRLVVELDGPFHDGQRDQDEARSRHLEAYGYQVLRFRNEDVKHDLVAVLDRIREIAATTQQTADGLPPLPNVGRGGLGG